MNDVDANNSRAFTALAKSIWKCLSQSDCKRDSGFDGSSTGWTSWVDEPSAAVLQETINRIALLRRKDASSSWLRWIQMTPTPMTFELSTQLRDEVLRVAKEAVLARRSRYNTSAAAEGAAASSLVLEEQENNNDTPQVIPENEFLERIGCRLLYLPSGSSLPSNLYTPPGGMVYGKLLLGGVTRFRLLGSQTARRPQRRAGERTAIVNSNNNYDNDDNDGWLQYGGPERNYQAVDMGPCLLLEMTLLPLGLAYQPAELPPSAGGLDSQQGGGEMIVTSAPFSPRSFLVDKEQATVSTDEETRTSSEASNSLVVDKHVQVCDLEASFCTSIGGLEAQIEQLVRRVLDGRVLRPVSEMMAQEQQQVAVDTTTNGATTSQNVTSTSGLLDQIRREEMQGLLELGLEPVRGVLLYGPPGSGKTLLAREISKILDARPPKIVAAPELLDRWVGGSEKLVRELFADAEAELDACGGDPTQSALHVVVIDEIDAVFRKRSASNADGSAEVTRASAVNQILSKLDGIKALGNVLVVGMTNRKELLDPALLRPGRLEVHIQIPLPMREGRRQILKIHFGALRSHGRLSGPLCDAIDGVSRFLAPTRRKRWSPLRRGQWWKRDDDDESIRIRDLAADRWTGGWSGADLAGLVRSAGSLALSRTREQGGDIQDLLITLRDVSEALNEVKQQ